MTTESPTPIPLPRLLLTVEQAAEVLGISRTRMFALLAAGTVDSVLIGHSRRIPTVALEEFVTHLRAGSANTPSR